MNSGKLIRKSALVVMILAYVGLLALLAFIPHWGFFWTFIVIGLAVGCGEIISVILTGKTLSTNFKYALQAGGKKRFFAFLALGALALAILSLIVHLAVYW